MSGERVKRRDTEADIIMLEDLQKLEIGEVRREHRFKADRRWRFDFCVPDARLAVEIEGGVSRHAKFNPNWQTMRHQQGEGYQRDLEKYNAAVLLGWNVLRFSTEDVRNGAAKLTLIEWKKAKERP